MSEFLETMTLDMSAVASLVSDLTTSGHVILSADQMTQLQSIDRLYQALQDLAAISATLADHPYTTKLPDPGLQLSETRAILDPIALHDRSAECGTLDLF